MRYTRSLFLLALFIVPGMPLTAQESAVPTSPKSVADGAKIFARSCASCHGRTGMGDGPAAKQLTPKPSNLVDAEWAHGATDSEIFAVIRSGVPKSAMKGFASKMTEHEIWDVINYLRSLGSSPVKQAP